MIIIEIGDKLLLILSGVFVVWAIVELFKIRGIKD